MKTFIESSTWRGGQDTGEALDMVSPSLGKSTVYNVDSAPEVKRENGNVSFYNEERGFGFIQSGHKRRFFHISDCEQLDTLIIPKGMDVNFIVSEKPDGKETAIDVRAS